MYMFMWYVLVYMCVCVCIYIYIYILEYYSTIKKNEILPFARTWVNLEGIILSEISEISQTEKDKHRMISLIYGI